MCKHVVCLYVFVYVYVCVIMHEKDRQADRQTKNTNLQYSLRFAIALMHGCSLFSLLDRNYCRKKKLLFILWLEGRRDRKVDRQADRQEWRERERE